MEGKENQGGRFFEVRTMRESDAMKESLWA